MALLIIFTALTDFVVLLFFGTVIAKAKKENEDKKVSKEFWKEEDAMSTLPGVHMASSKLMMGIHIQAEVVDFLEEKYGPFEEEDE